MGLGCIRLTEIMREFGCARKESARNKHRNKFASKSDTY